MSQTTTPERTPPNRSPRAAGIPEAQLQAWEKLQVDLATKADFTDAKLRCDPSHLIGDAPSSPSSTTAAAAAAAASAAPPQQAPSSSSSSSSSGAAMMMNPAAALATTGLAASTGTALPPLRYVGGLDISFVKDTSVAVASLVVLDLMSQQQQPASTVQQQGAVKNKDNAVPPVVYEDMLHCTMPIPYVPGFLAFREVDPLRELVKRIKAKAPQFVPQVYFVDGNGTMHYRKCGLATHFGVLEDVPIVGVAKGLLAVDGLSREPVEKLVKEAAAKKLQPGQVGEDGSFVYHGTTLTPIRGSSGFLYAYGALTGNSSTKPVYISPGTNISMRTAALLAVRLAIFRVVEPIRQADLRSRQYVKENLTISKDDD